MAYAACCHHEQALHCLQSSSVTSVSSVHNVDCSTLKRFFVHCNTSLYQPAIDARPYPCIKPHQAASSRMPPPPQQQLLPSKSRFHSACWSTPRLQRLVWHAYFRRRGAGAARSQASRMLSKTTICCLRAHRLLPFPPSYPFLSALTKPPITHLRPLPTFSATICCTCLVPLFL